MNQRKTPIALFSYNRPQHVERALNTLALCTRLDECDLHIFSDGLRVEAHRAGWEAAQRIVRGRAAEFNATVVEHPENMGCSPSIVKHVTELCRAYGRVIIVEDDFVMNPGYVSYLLDGLDRYEHEPAVYQISAYMFPVELPPGQDAFLETRPVKRALLLNCLDAMYGHCVLKLLNAQYYLDQHPQLDLIVLIPEFLRWLVPAGVAAIWSVDLPLGRGAEWNDWLAREIGRRVAEFDQCWLSVAVSHPHPQTYNIERFTGVVPFALEQWAQRRPTVTFVWRDDRLWSVPAGGGRWTRLTRLIKRGFISRRKHQQRRLIKFAQALRKLSPDIDFAVAGVAQPGGLPEWITDLRRPEPDAVRERAWCERYAASHCVVGVHGSNMLLPSAHAGATVELMPAGHWGNMLQEILFRNEDLRSAVFRHRVLPINTDPVGLAAAVSAVLRTYPDFAAYMAPAAVAHPVI